MRRVRQAFRGLKAWGVVALVLGLTGTDRELGAVLEVQCLATLDSKPALLVNRLIAAAP